MRLYVFVSPSDLITGTKWTKFPYYLILVWFLPQTRPDRSYGRNSRILNLEHELTEHPIRQLDSSLRTPKSDGQKKQERQKRLMFT